MLAPFFIHNSCMKPEEYFKERKERLEQEIVELAKTHNTYSFVRLILFLLVVAGIYLFAIGFSVFGAILSIALFVSVLIFDGRINTRLKRKKALKALITDELKSNEQLSHPVFGDGTSYIDPKHPYSYDIDIFGKGSVFSRINRTVTSAGEKLLAVSLSTINKNTDEIRFKQAAVQELMNENDFRHLFLVEKYLNPNVPEDDLNELLNSPLLRTIDTRKFRFKAMLVVFPLLFFALLILAIAGVVHGNYPVVAFVLNLFIVGHYTKRINGYHKIIDVISKNLKRDMRLLNTFEKLQPQSDKLIDLKTELIDKHDSALQGIKQSENLLNAFENRLNLLAAFIINGLFLRDLWLILRFNNWLKHYAGQVPLWIDRIAELDELVSLSDYCFKHPDFSFPDPQGKDYLDAEELGHPLIAKSKRINNDFVINSTGELHIVTGANMSGKSTFLRTVLLNLVLASTGSAVCAKRFAYRPASVFSSIRTFDNLIDDVSYFQAELIRLKEMMKEAGKGEPVVIAIDEPLKGTNSADKRSGSVLLLKKMIGLPVCGLVATHDLELQVLAKESKKFHLICFELEFRGDQVIYDYKLREGVTSTMNATILMKNMKLI